MAKLPGPTLETDEEGVPLIYARALQIYDYMLANVEDSVFENDYQQYKGRITDEVHSELGITPSQYSRSMELLKSVNAVQQVGRSNEGSQWILLYRPTVEDFEAVREERFRKRKRPSKQDIQQQRIADITQVLQAHEDRISELERLYGQD